MVYVITVHLHANDHPDSVDKIKAKLIEASRVYSKDKETLSWFVMQSTSDPRDFTIVERYEKESVSQFTPNLPRRSKRRRRHDTCYRRAGEKPHTSEEERDTHTSRRQAVERQKDKTKKAGN